MSRWRPPAKKSSPYITPQGYKALEVEYKALWEKRAEVTAAVTAAAAEGDRSENAEYIYRKKQLREMDRRITYLQKRMPTLTVVDKIADDGKIYFGCSVTLEDLDSGNEVVYRIVGADEINTENNHISIDAPLSRALLGKSIDDDIIIKINNETKEYIVLDIQLAQD